MTDRELMDMAAEAAKRAYAPYSRFPVGAALSKTQPWAALYAPSARRPARR